MRRRCPVVLRSLGSASGLVALELVGLIVVAGTCVLSLLTAAPDLGNRLTRAVSCTVAQVAQRPADGCADEHGPAAAEGGQGQTISVAEGHDLSPGASDANATPLPIYQESDGPPEVTDDDPYTYDPGAAPGALKPTVPIRRCSLARTLPGCPAKPGGTVVALANITDLSYTEQDVRAEKALRRNVDWAAGYYYESFGWSGFDGVGAAFQVEPHAQRRDDYDGYYGATHPVFNQMRFTDEASSGELGRSTAIHEVTHHVFNQIVGRTFSVAWDDPASAQGAAILEAFPMMAELEVSSTSNSSDYVDNLVQPLPQQPRRPWVCPGTTDKDGLLVETLNWNYDSAAILVAAYADIARSSGTVTLGGGRSGAEDLDPSWERAGQLRFQAMRELANRPDPEFLTFGDIRTAFLAAAPKVAMDVGIVGAAFDRQGITSESWMPTPASKTCVYSEAFDL